ncbi:MAG: DUF2855 family protein [Nocardioides sp.]|nr:DUF2855 family protein [Nocardioidaceae bacterium]MCB8955303.1 DUF2855 family protein [Nocardioides sp.]
MDLEIRRDDVRETRLVDRAVPEPDEGQVLLRVESFGLTSNNITYAVFGDAMRYWDFFPVSEAGWGRVPVWGHARVERSRHPEVVEGARVYGYLPAGTDVVLTPSRVTDRGFADASPHRADLPAAYQTYRNVSTDPIHSPELEAEQELFFPLFITSFLVDDFLADEHLLDTDAVVLSSASSKTAIIAAYLLSRRDAVHVVGLTSAGNREFVTELDIYDAVLDYSETADLPGQRAVYVDFSGSGEVRRDVHTRYADGLIFSSVVGATHWTEMSAGGEHLPGARPTFFFAPDRVAKRTADWGGPALDRTVADAWIPFARWASEWLQVARVSTPEGLQAAYLDLVEGRTDPAGGTIVSI